MKKLDRAINELDGLCTQIVAFASTSTVDNLEKLREHRLEFNSLMISILVGAPLKKSKHDGQYKPDTMFIANKVPSPIEMKRVYEIFEKYQSFESILQIHEASASRATAEATGMDVIDPSGEQLEPYTFYDIEKVSEKKLKCVLLQVIARPMQKRDIDGILAMAYKLRKQRRLYVMIGALAVIASGVGIAIGFGGRGDHDDEYNEDGYDDEPVYYEEVGDDTDGEIGETDESPVEEPVVV